MSDVYSQDGFSCRLEWGRHGARRSVERGDALVVVDTLSFSTSVVTAVTNGALIYPCADDEDPHAIAAQVGAEVAAHRLEAREKGGYSLSPTTMETIPPNTRLVVGSLNGSTCARYARDCDTLIVGALVNAEAVARAVQRLVDAGGERWSTPNEDGELRFALEDALGAGAVLSYVRGEKSPEARLCEAAFRDARDDLERVLLECGSGRELVEKGFGEDVIAAARLNRYAIAPRLEGSPPYFTTLNSDDAP